MNNNNDDGEALDITELPTGEYPALSADDTLALNGADEPHAAVNGAAAAHEPDHAEADKASFWLAHLEAEVTRLHAKWQGIDAEFKNREARAAELQQAIDTREATIDKLNADVEREAALLQAAEERLAGKDAELVALVDDRRARDERIAALASELADAAVAHKAALAKLEHAEAEIARLNEALRQEQAATAAIAKENEALLAEQHRLQAKLQDLEIYINGRHDSWSELNAKLADYRDSVLRLEKTVEARDVASSRQDDEKRQLAAKILELERARSSPAAGKNARKRTTSCNGGSPATSSSSSIARPSTHSS